MADHLHKMTPGWLLPYLLAGDAHFGPGRWAYWLDTLAAGQVLPDPIPPLALRLHADAAVRDNCRRLEQLLAFMMGRGHRFDAAWTSFVAWLLHGFHDPEFAVYNLPTDIPGMRADADVLDHWYTAFELGRLQQAPYDYVGAFAQGLGGKHANVYAGMGFFATPAPVAWMMAQAAFVGVDPHDAKRMSVCDPCCGTGIMLLAASDFSLNLYGQDISPDLCRMCKVNGWLYVPWLVCWPADGPTREELFGALAQTPIPVTNVETPALVAGQDVLPGFAISGERA